MIITPDIRITLWFTTPLVVRETRRVLISILISMICCIDKESKVFKVPGLSFICSLVLNKSLSLSAPHFPSCKMKSFVYWFRKHLLSRRA